MAWEHTDAAGLTSIDHLDLLPLRFASFRGSARLQGSWAGVSVSIYPSRGQLDSVRTSLRHCSELQERSIAQQQRPLCPVVGEDYTMDQDMSREIDIIRGRDPSAFMRPVLQ